MLSNKLTKEQIAKDLGASVCGIVAVYDEPNI